MKSLFAFIEKIKKQFDKLVNDHRDTLTQYRVHLIVTASALAGIFIGTYVFAMPMPIVSEAVQQAGGASVQGKTWPNAMIIISDDDGRIIATTVANERGEFTVADAQMSADEKTIFVRAFHGSRRSSSPRRVTLLSVYTPRQPVAEAPADSDLPPPGIPPVTKTEPTPTKSAATSTAPAPKPESKPAPTSTPPTKPAPKVLVASAMLSNMTPKSGSNVRLTVNVQDGNGRRVDDAEITLKIEYPDGSQAKSVRGGDGTYSTRFEVPDDIKGGTIVPMKIVVMKSGYVTTVINAAFTVK